MKHISKITHAHPAVANDQIVKDCTPLKESLGKPCEDS